MMKIFKFILLTFFCISAYAKPLIIGTDGVYPPFDYRDENSTLVGFDVDLIDAISKKAGFEYEFIVMGFDGLIPALKTGKIDIIASAMSVTSEREKAVDFSDNYFLTENLYLKRADNTSIKSLNDLKGKKIGVLLGSAQEFSARKIAGVNVIPTKEIFTSILALKNGKVDVVLVDNSIGYGFLKKNTDLAWFHKQVDDGDGFAFAFDKGKFKDLITKFNTALKEIKADGTYDKLLEKYELK
ncbi:basic amino acid ABC transporter substrate-binding protein [Campylobacter geochelonis]|uniref:basic amino acid ABC transporter substrate-binding protein n=1 Tax=Campylobacter geochelonis TaxID=1780362 RepID=UPI003BF52332